LISCREKWLRRQSWLRYTIKWNVLTWQAKVDGMQGRMKLLVEEKEIIQRELLSLHKQLDYYKVSLP
jgi:hypothetical protein